MQADALARSAEAGFDLKAKRFLSLTNTQIYKARLIAIESWSNVTSVPLFVNRAEVPKIAHTGSRQAPPNVVSLNAEDQLSLAGMQVFSFATSHDAASSFGFAWKR